MDDTKRRIMKRNWTDIIGDAGFALRNKAEKVTLGLKWHGLMTALRGFDWKQLRSSKGIRSFAQRPIVGAVVSLVVIALCAVYLYVNYYPKPIPPPKLVERYFDLGTGKLFLTNGTPPLPAPSGKIMADGSPAGVRAHAYACDCTDPSQWRVVLETFSPEATRILKSGRGEEEREEVERGRLIARKDLSGGWVPLDSEEGAEIMAEARADCAGGGIPRECKP